jgi:hypothetical protein
LQIADLRLQIGGSREFGDYKTSYSPTSAKNIDSDILACYQFYLTERSFSKRMAQNAILSLHYVVIGSSGLIARHL